MTSAEPTFSRCRSFKPCLETTPRSIRKHEPLQTHPGYTYEVYGNPTFADLSWRVLPFSLSAQTAPDRNKYTATTERMVKLYLRNAAERGFYRVSFRVPGANAGTP